MATCTWIPWFPLINPVFFFLVKSLEKGSFGQCSWNFILFLVVLDFFLIFLFTLMQIAWILNYVYDLFIFPTELLMCSPANENKTKTMLWYSLCHHSGGQLSGVVQLRKVRKKTTLFKVSQRMSGNVRKFEKLREVYLKRSGKGKCFNCLPSITAVFTHCNILAVMCRKF